MLELRTPDPQVTHRLRLNTLIKLRWLAIVGQSAAVLIVAYGFEFPLPVSICFALIAISAWLNLYLAFRYPATHRLRPFAALGIMVFDAFQLAGLLYLTGGLTNPFSLLMTVPVVVSATSLPLRMTIGLGALAVAMVTLLVFFHMPLPWFAGAELPMPFVYVAGMWVAKKKRSECRRYSGHLRSTRKSSTEDLISMIQMSPLRVSATRSARRPVDSDSSGSTCAPMADRSRWTPRRMTMARSDCRPSTRGFQGIGETMGMGRPCHHSGGGSNRCARLS